MNEADSVLLSVSAEARQLVPPDYAVLDGLIEHTAASKVEALRSVSASLDLLVADLRALGAAPFDEGAGRRPLTWSAYSSTTRQERSLPNHRRFPAEHVNAVPGSWSTRPLRTMPGLPGRADLRESATAGR